jgi:hypothetical protein
MICSAGLIRYAGRAALLPGWITVFTPLTVFKAADFGERGQETYVGKETILYLLLLPHL